MRVKVDPDRCIGSGQCVLIASDVFDQNDVDGTVVLLVEEVPSAQQVGARQAAASCPARAISLDE